MLRRSEQGRAGMLRPLPGTLITTHLSRLETSSHRLYRSPEHLGPRIRQRRSQRNMDPVHLDLNHRKVRGPHRAQVSVRGRPGHSWGRAGEEGEANYATELCQIRSVRHSDGYCMLWLSGDPGFQGKLCIQRTICWLVDELPEEGFTPQVHWLLLD